MEYVYITLIQPFYYMWLNLHIWDIYWTFSEKLAEIGFKYETKFVYIMFICIYLNLFIKQTFMSIRSSQEQYQNGHCQTQYFNSQGFPALIVFSGDSAQLTKVFVPHKWRRIRLAPGLGERNTMIV